METSFGNDPAVYWVKVVYDTGRVEIYDHLRLNQAYELACSLENQKKRQHRTWHYERISEHIIRIDAGRDIEDTRRGAA